MEDFMMETRTSFLIRTKRILIVRSENSADAKFFLESTSYKFIVGQFKSLKMVAMESGQWLDVRGFHYNPLILIRVISM